MFAKQNGSTIFKYDNQETCTAFLVALVCTHHAPVEVNARSDVSHSLAHDQGRGAAAVLHHLHEGEGWGEGRHEGCRELLLLFEKQARVESGPAGSGVQHSCRQQRYFRPSKRLHKHKNHQCKKLQTSNPRKMSPFASSIVFPCSRVRIFARSSCRKFGIRKCKNPDSANIMYFFESEMPI